MTDRDFDSSSGLLGFWKIGDDDGGGGDSGDSGGGSFFAPGLLVWSPNGCFPSY